MNLFIDSFNFSTSYKLVLCLTVQFFHSHPTLLCHIGYYNTGNQVLVDYLNKLYHGDIDQKKLFPNDMIM